MTEIVLSQAGPAGRLLAGAIPSGLQSCWCMLRLPRMPDGFARAVFAFGGVDDVAVTCIAPPRSDGTVRALLYIPADMRELRVELLGVREIPARVSVLAKPVSRAVAAALIVARAPGPVLRAAFGGRAGWGRRVRAALAQASGIDALHDSYALWTMLFDHWSDDEIARLLASPRRPDWPAFRVVVLAADGESSSAARATLASLAAQVVPARATILTPEMSLASALDGPEPYVALLQAGEIVPPHAAALVGEWMARHGAPACLYADEDAIDASGERLAPLFKPQPNLPLMLSGTLTRGLWLFRRDAIASHLPERASWAEPLRLDLWLRLWEAGLAPATGRVPFVLAHRRTDAASAPPDVIAATVAAHLARVGRNARIEAAEVPIRVAPTLPDSARRSVALVVPSALRAPHVARCLRAVLATTAHAALELVIVVSQATPLDEAQRKTLAALGDDRRLRVSMVPVTRFNYSAANNAGAQATEAEFLCLLNDDVAPCEPAWLDTMLGHFADPGIGAVGARLLYENGSVQHAGIIMGIGGLADHAHRFLPRTAPGYAQRAVLNQELSAVTGACLLVRRAAYQEVGGMDESFPVAFNDVDFCLRLRAAGHRIVYCADAELTHYESLSLGHHFSGERAALEREEVRRMRERWPEVVRADPFHNPNLSLIRGHEWSPAFPPRVRKTDYLTFARPLA